MLTEDVIRRALLRRLTGAAATSEGVLVEEMAVAHGATRVDVAMINGRLHGYEIKSESDTLRRLPRQIELYSATMERVTLIVALRHAAAALRHVPTWWAVELVQSDQSGNVRFNLLRDGQDNPAPDTTLVAALLWRSEALAIMNDLSISAGFERKRRNEIYSRLAGAVGPSELFEIVRERLKTRLQSQPVMLRTLCDD